MKTEKANVIYVSDINELYEKVKHARRGTTYVLLDYSRVRPITGHSDLMKEAKMMEFLISFLRVLNVEWAGAVVFRKHKSKR